MAASDAVNGFRAKPYKTQLNNLCRRRKGGFSELRALLWLLSNGYEVFHNPTKTGPIDIVAVDLSTGATILVDVKTAQILDNGTISAAGLKDEQKKLGIRVIAVTDNWVGWLEDWPVPKVLRPYNRTNTCGHPERAHKALGMCAQCRNALRYQRNVTPTTETNSEPAP